MRHVTDLGRWEVTLLDDAKVEVWATGYEERDGTYVFSVLADVDESAQEELLIAGRTPANRQRVLVGLARFPVAIVTGIRGG